MCRSSARVLIFIAAALTLGGCMTPPVRWHHDPGERIFEPSGRSLLVAPIMDERALINEPAPWWRWLPLVPWAMETDAAFDLALAHSGSRRGSVPNPEFRFDAADDLHWAALRQIGTGGLFSPVFKSVQDVGEWPERGDSLCTLRIRVEALTLSRRHWRYGLGPLAPAAFALGAPRTSFELLSAMEFTIDDPAGQAIASERLDAVIIATDGWYYSSDARQRVLDELSFRFGEALDRLQAEITTSSLGGKP